VALLLPSERKGRFAARPLPAVAAEGD
jgi:hypothetical protein